MSTSKAEVITDLDTTAETAIGAPYVEKRAEFIAGLWETIGFAISEWEGAGGGGTPSDTVTDGTAYGNPPVAGTSDDYSRGDHDHGSPDLPTPGDIGADLAGAAAAAQSAAQSYADGIVASEATTRSSADTALAAPQYIVIALSGTLPSDRRLQATAPIVLTDGGANADAMLTHADSAVTPATKGSATAAPVVTVDAKGHVTTLTETTITPAWGSVTGTPTTLAGYGITDATLLALGGVPLWSATASHRLLVSDGEADVESSPMQFGTPSGTPSAANTTERPGTKYTTGATSGNPAGPCGVINLREHFRTSYGSIVYMRLGFATDATITSERIWIGAIAYSASSTNVDDFPSASILLRYSTLAGDATFQLSVDDGTTQTLVDTTVTVSTSTEYDVVFDITGTTVGVTINGSTRVSTTLTIPANTVSLQAHARITTLTNAARAFVFFYWSSAPQ